MNVEANLSDGSIDELIVKKSGSTKATFRVDGQIAKLSSVRTNSPTRLYQSMRNVVETEYVDEIVIFDAEVTDFRITEAELDELSEEAVSDVQ